MAIFDLNASEFLQFVGVAAVTWLVMWWGVRPLSFVYRVKQGRISVRTFFLLPMASVKLSEVSQFKASRPAGGKPLRWLVSPFRRWSGQMVFAETKREWLALPDRFIGELAAWPSGVEADAQPPAQFRGDAGYQHILAGLMASNRAVRKLATCCAPLAGPAAWCMIFLPLWLTWMELTGSKMCAAEYRLPLSAVIDRESWPHFAASAFLIACGIAARGLLAFGMPLPWPLAGISLFAAVSRLSLSFPASHDVLSHRLFDSCTGYDERHALIGTTCLVAVIILLLATWNPDGRRAQAESFFPATP
jgi:hypothetical protein